MHLRITRRGDGVDMPLAAAAGNVAVRVVDHPLRKAGSELGFGHLTSPSEPVVRDELTAELPTREGHTRQRGPQDRLDYATLPSQDRLLLHDNR